MKSLKFNFNKKKVCKDTDFQSILKDVKYVICSYVRLNCDINQAWIVEYGDGNKLHVAYPPEALGGCTRFEDWFNCDTVEGKIRGMIYLNGHSTCRRFSLKDGVLYIGKCGSDWYDGWKKHGC